MEEETRVVYLTFLGTSDARGVPRMMCDCKVCRSAHPLNRRMRPGVAIQTNNGTTLIDIPPDFRAQFLRYGNKTIPTTALITHTHNDHIGGIGDYADLCRGFDVHVQLVSPSDSILLLTQRYPYLTNASNLQFIASETWRVEPWDVTFHKVNHGANGYAYGIRFAGESGAWGYMPDVFQATAEQLEPFQRLDLLIIGTAYWWENIDPAQRSIYDVQEALALKDELGVASMVLTHLSHDIDVVVRRAELPAEVQFAFDGMQLPLPI